MKKNKPVFDFDKYTVGEQVEYCIKGKWFAGEIVEIDYDDEQAPWYVQLDEQHHEDYGMRDWFEDNRVRKAEFVIDEEPDWQ